MKIVTLGFFFIFTACMVSAVQPRLLVVDTGFNDPYTYRNFLLLAQSVGFNAQVKPFYALNEPMLNEYECILFNIDGFLAQDYYRHKKNGQALSPIARRCFALLSSVRNKKCVCGVMLPNRIGPTLQSSVERAYTLCSKFFPFERHVKKTLIKFLEYLFQSDSKRSLRYHTALLTKNDTFDKTLELKPKTDFANCINEKTKTVFCAHLPYYAFQSAPALAWYCVHPKTHERFFVTKASLMLFSEIGENFIYNPLEFAIRTRKLEELQQLLYELFCITTQGKLVKHHTSKKISLPEAFSKKSLQSSRERYSALRAKRADPLLYGWINKELLWCSFGELDPYINKKALQNLLSTKLNLWWLECYPEWYLSCEALKPNEQKDFLEKINTITSNFKELTKSYEGHSKPHFFIGTGLTSNFSKKKVHNSVVDAYGTVYSKIPSPFDKINFWKEEVYDVFERFVKEWSIVGNSVPIAGIFLDLEMYHAQDQTGHYLPTMDFSDLAWNLYCNATGRKDRARYTTTNRRIRYLLSQNEFDTYFKILEKEAHAIGTALKMHIQKLIPQALIALYDMYLPHNWFYKGFLAGLSSAERPIILATFNNDFYSHMPWLIKNHIYAYHLPVLLLSKFKNENDFYLINELIQFHDGIWFNRISRLEESRDPRQWSWDYGLEVTPLPTDVFIAALRKKIYEVCKSNVFQDDTYCIENL